MNDLLRTTTLAGGCFWCLEAVFRRVKGVREVVSGYTGGTVADPTYDEVCTGETGHAEAVRITFDSSIVTFDDLLGIFWTIHDPTTPNRQGADVGSQYRSAIFFEDEEQRLSAERSKRRMEQAGFFRDPIVTEIEPLAGFFPAEEYHRRYYETNRVQPYCRMVIDPKIRKLRESFAHLLA